MHCVKLSLQQLRLIVQLVQFVDDAESHCRGSNGSKNSFNLELKFPGVESLKKRHWCWKSRGILDVVVLDTLVCDLKQ